MLNVVATLQQRCGNVLITSESDVVTASETDVGTALIFDHATALRQHQQRHCDNIVAASLCQLESVGSQISAVLPSYKRLTFKCSFY